MGSGLANAQPLGLARMPGDGRKGRVLCVDDEPGILRSLQWLLQKHFDVELASNGTEGLGRVRAASYDVVISDQRMPGMMGSEFLREVRRVSPRSMRILLTGYSDLPALLRSVNDGEVFRFISKPWKLPELLQAVEEAARIARGAPVPPPAPAIEPVETATLALRSEHILVIDDNPAALDMVRDSAGPDVGLVVATDLARARAAADDPRIGIIVSNMRVAGADATRMLKELKARHPAVVAIVYTDATDAIDVIGLINQAQILRFLPKPVKPTTLRLALAAAALKRQQLRDNPALLQRYTVQPPGPAAGDAPRPPQARRAEPADTLWRRVADGLQRLLGRG